VSNVAPTVTETGASSVAEGAIYFLTLDATDPGLDHVFQWLVNWGDSAPETVFAGSHVPLTPTHPDRPAGYSITALARAQDGVYAASSPVAVHVSNAPPTLTLSGAGQVNEGTAYVLGLSSSDPGVDTISQWTINWGDGTFNAVTGNPSSATHVYADGPNDYT